MQAENHKNKGGIFSEDRPQIKIFSKKRLIHFVDLKADVFESLGRSANQSEETQA